MSTNTGRLARALQEELQVSYTDALERVRAAEAIPGLLLEPRGVYLAANAALLARMAGGRRFTPWPKPESRQPAVYYFGDPDEVVLSSGGSYDGQVVWRCVSGELPARLQRRPADPARGSGYSWGGVGGGSIALAWALAYDVAGREDFGAARVVLDFEVSAANRDRGYLVSAADVAQLAAAVPPPAERAGRP